VCDLEISRMGVPYIYDISRLRVKGNLSNSVRRLGGETLLINETFSRQCNLRVNTIKNGIVLTNIS